MAGLGQRFLESGGGLTRRLLAMSRRLPGGAVRCWLGVALLIFIQVDALEANQVEQNQHHYVTTVQQEIFLNVTNNCILTQKLHCISARLSFEEEKTKNL